MPRLILLVGIALLSFAVSPDDRAIESSLKTRLARSKIRQNPIQYKVENRVVTWTGKVTIPQHKGAATRMAKAAGARRVLNQIVVTGGGSSANRPAPRPVTVQAPRR
jgi:osmotically-inducible protein OsmY